MTQIQKCLVLLACICCWIVVTQPTVAQSFDARQPTVLTSRSVSGEDELRGQNQFYVLDAGPGDIGVSVSASTDYSSASMHIVFSNKGEVELLDVPVSVSTSGSKKVARLHLSKREPILMKLMFPLKTGTRLNYTIQLDGPIGLDSDAEKSIHPAVPRGDAGAIELHTTGSSLPVTSQSASVLQTLKQATPNSVEDSPIEDKWALIVGISKFQKPEVNLKYSAKDAKDLRDFLVNEANFAPDHVKLLTDEQATKERVLAELGDKWLPRVAHPNDLVLIFISTHGSPTQMDLEGLNYLVMHNTDPDSLYATGLPLQDLANTIKQRVHSNRVVLIVDACHSGSANPAKGITRIGNFDTNELVQGTGQMVICSSKPNQVSWESKRYANGVFTRNLIEALRLKTGKTTFGQAFDHMKDSVESEVLQDRSELQSPIMKSLWKGSSLILTAPPSKPRPVPEELKARP